MREVILCQTLTGDLMRQIALEFTLSQFGRYEFKGQIEALVPIKFHLKYRCSAEALVLLIRLTEISAFNLEQKGSLIRLETCAAGLELTFTQAGPSPGSLKAKEKIKLIRKLVEHGPQRQSAQLMV